MNFRSLVEKIFGEDKELAAAEKWFMEGGASSKSTSNGSDKTNTNNDVLMLCKRLLDPKNEGIHKDQVTADSVTIIQNAADNGNGLAAYVMGQLYEFGLEVDGETIVEEEPDKMLEYYRIGAEAGDPFAQSEYGQQLCNGVDGSTEHEDGDDEAGFPWIVKAGENGNVFALHRMTNAYIDGSYGQKVNFEKALACFKRILEVKDSAEWPDEMILRAKGYIEFLPRIIAGDVGAMRPLGEWLKAHEGDWDYTWGYGDSDSESEFWLKK